jgi:N-acetylglucosaminyldiphosphoundecaprenol N-acetyl-beta-D-mannosaminyltransferase
MDQERYRIGKVYVNITDPDKAKQQVKEAVAQKKGGYICLSDVRSVSYGNSHPDYAEVLNNSTYTFTDGMPLIWMARLWGIKSNQRTAGPILFTSVMEDKSNGLKHFMLGDTEETLAALEEKYPDSGIVRTYSPPFCEVDDFDYEGIAEMINETDANIIWVALHAPKQDYFSARLAPLLTDGKVCVDVGAAFRFALGQYKMPPKWAQKLGIIGLFWRKLSWWGIKWYIVESSHLLKWCADILFSRVRGKYYFD